MHILVAEDDKISRELLRHILEAEPGHTLVLVADGGEAWSRLEDPGARFDACVLDIQMPKLDGLELAARIRADARLARTPIVLCTAANDRATVERAAGLAVSGYIVKPYTRARVLETLRRIGSNRPPADPPAAPTLEESGVVCQRLGIDAVTHLTLLAAMLNDLREWAGRLRAGPVADAAAQLVRADGLEVACLSLGAAGGAEHLGALRGLLQAPDPPKFETVLGSLESEISELAGHLESQKAA